ncbi:MAG: acyl carrier protein [Clostridia bacterium]|nr:acyl carrier protein [Clostridia bacterium]MBR6512973.1 acyl carrier protein [Clostridia bacterium]
MNMVFEKIRAMIAEQLEIEEESITMDSALIEDLGADSLDVVDLVMSIEDEFEIEVPDEAIENMRTIGDAVRFIEGTK